MKELQDYTEAFDPNLQMKDFSKGFLLDLWKLSAQLYVALSAAYENPLRKKYGDDVAHEVGVEAFKWTAAYDVRRLRALGKVEGNDIASLFKLFQLHPGFSPLFDTKPGTMDGWKLELKNNNYGVMTIYQCLSLEYIEKTNDEWLIKHACLEGSVDQIYWIEFAHAVNPKIRLIQLKVPPRKSKKEMACQFAFELEK